jgi:hypothetical protein
MIGFQESVVRKINWSYSEVHQFQSLNLLSTKLGILFGPQHLIHSL